MTKKSKSKEMYDTLLESANNAENIMSDPLLIKINPISAYNKLADVASVIEIVINEADFKANNNVELFMEGVKKISHTYKEIISDKRYRHLMSKVDMFMAVYNMFEKNGETLGAKIAFDKDYLYVHKNRQEITPSIFSKVENIAIEQAYEMYYGTPYARIREYDGDNKDKIDK